MGDYSVVLSVLVVMVLAWQASAQTCLKSFSSESKSYAICNDLAVLNAALSWTYFPGNGSIDIAFRATPAATAGWVGWGINPSKPQMVGTQALIAFKHTNGSMVVYTYDIESTTAAPQPSSISITVSNKSAIYESSSGHITIFATLTLPSNKTSINHVWQVGSQVTNLAPQQHALSQANLQSATTINLNTGVSSGSVVIPNKTLKDRHGVLNVVGWGILMPIGAMIARYLRMFESADPAWFYLHAFCQSSGYILGVAGWATGLKLGSDSPGVEQTSHRRIGIALFCLGTLQVFALLLRPKKDHKYRKYWNVYHYSIGYSVIILSIINIFKGYDILKPEDKWKHAYIAVIASLGGIAAVLEVATWIIFFQRKSKTSPRDVNTAYGNGGMNTGHGFKQSHDHNSV